MESRPPWAEGSRWKNYVGGERNPQESQKSRQDNRGPLTSLTSDTNHPSYFPGPPVNYR